MTILIVSLIIITGLVFLAIEFFLVPGFSVPGIAGIIVIGYGVFMANNEFGASGALVTIAVSLVAAAILVVGALRSRTIRKVGLDYSQKGTRAVDDYSSLIGKTGTALSDLRPAGTAIIDGKRCDVVTDSEYIDANSEIIVQEIEGTRIIVTLNQGR